MLRIVVTTLLATPVVAALMDGGACQNDEDCNMAGRCMSGVCACERGFTGVNCELLALGKSYSCGEGGLCMHGELNNVATWGGSSVLGDDGKWHMYAAMFPNNTLRSWLTNSQIVHAVADSPAGPYVAADVALGPRGSKTDSFWDSITVHNPQVARAPDGTYLLYYMGSSQKPRKGESGLTIAGCNTGAREKHSACMQRVGLATASKPDGPWTRRDEPILALGPSGSWDDDYQTNPSPHIFSNGSVLLVYKARSFSNHSLNSMGVAFAEHWSGMYMRRSGPIVDLGGRCEDAGIFRSPSGIFRMVTHCGCDYRVLWSLDGFDWHNTAENQPWCDFQLADGSAGSVNRRERPFWIIGANGEPTHLLTSVQPHDGEPVDKQHGVNTWTMVTELPSAQVEVVV